ncbi:MAG: hypothetical protein IJ542_00635 [Clostridia bacterium]|nr:hypothetical protein [Clostridia bacterium]
MEELQTKANEIIEKIKQYCNKAVYVGTPTAVVCDFARQTTKNIMPELPQYIRNHFTAFASKYYSLTQTRYFLTNLLNKYGELTNEK